jgi:hypothetical protein
VVGIRRLPSMAGDGPGRWIASTSVPAIHVGLAAIWTREITVQRKPKQLVIVNAGSSDVESFEVCGRDISSPN